MNTACDQSDELLIGFIDESISGLQELATLLHDHRAQPADAAAINSVFRAIHSIKGNAGFFGLTAIKKFAHSLENTLDDVRNGRLALDEKLERALVEGFDLLEGSLGGVQEGEVASELSPPEEELLRLIAELCESCAVELSSEDWLLKQIAELAAEIAASNHSEAHSWARRLRSLLPQETAAEEPAPAAAPTPQHFQNARCELAGEDVTAQVAALVELLLATERGEYDETLGKDFLTAAGAFAGWCDERKQAELAGAIRTAAADFETIFNSPLDVDSMLLSVVWDRLAPALGALLASPAGAATAATPETSTASPPSASGAVDEDAGEPDASAKPGKGAIGNAKARFVRVREECVDDFLDDVSSLFITCERLKDVQARMASARGADALVEELRQVNTSFSAQTKALQHSVVALRQVPIRGLLSKFPRLARSLATGLKKKINVHLAGEEIEVDKALAEALDSPLTHMVRNVADHAIETPEERIARGVDEAGNLWISAEQTRTHVTLVVRDDGRGIDPHRLRAKAVEKRVISAAAAAAMSDHEAIELIFHPGFSTAEKISDVSGRGVGMDVVRTNLREHGGDIQVESVVGAGTTFRMEFPLRQAVVVLDGLLVEQSRGRYVLPFEHIREICEFESGELKSVQGSLVANVRGIPYGAISLSDVLDLEPSPPRPGATTIGVLVSTGNDTLCLLVERILGQRKVVINSLQEILPGVRSVAGVAQLGGGQLALVLSAKELIKAEPACGGWRWSPF